MTNQDTPTFAKCWRLAIEALRIDEDDERLQVGMDEPCPFGKDFYLLWTAIMPGAADPELFCRLYPDASPARYEQLCAFTEKVGEDLLARLKEGLEAFQPYYALKLGRDKLRMAHDDARVRILDEAMGNLGFCAIGFYGIDKLDPVLEELATRMRQVSIEPADFYEPILETSSDVDYKTGPVFTL